MKNSEKTRRKAIISELVKSKRRKRSRGEVEYSGFSITPKGVLLLTLDEVYGIGASLEKFDEFSAKLLERLSSMATAGKSTSLLGENFNDFFQLYVDTINLCGRMKKALDDNGIDFDMDDKEE